MLLQNNNQVIFTVHIHLIFDNDTEKEGDINNGDYLLLKFKRNGNKLLRACRVIDIRPVLFTTQPESYSASLLVDCSNKFDAERLRVASIDILDFRIVSKEFIDALAPDYIVTDAMINSGATPIITPTEIYSIPGIDTAGIGKAQILV